MTLAINNRTFKGISNLSLVRLEDGLIWSFPKPVSFVLSTNLEQRIQSSRSETGEMVRVGAYPVSKMPMLEITYPTTQFELLSFAQGLIMKAPEGANTKIAARYPKQVVAKTGGYPAAETGYWGFGIAADAGLDATNPAEKSVASITQGNVTVPLTQVAYAADVVTGTLSFGVGANGALSFSQDLIDKQEVINLSIPYEITGKQMSEEVVGPHSISATLVDSTNAVSLFYAPYISPDSSGVNIDPGAESFVLRAFVNSLPGSCQPFNLIECGGLKVKC